MHKIDKSTRQPILFATKWPIPKIPASTYRFERILKRRGEIVRESRHDGLVAWRNIKRVEKRYHREAAAQRHRRRRTRRERTRNKTINRRKQLPWPTNSPFFYLSLSLSLSLSHYITTRWLRRAAVKMWLMISARERRARSLLLILPLLLSYCLRGAFPALFAFAWPLVSPLILPVFITVKILDQLFARRVPAVCNTCVRQSRFLGKIVNTRNMFESFAMAHSRLLILCSFSV